MSEQLYVGDSQEAVALVLMQMIMAAEGRVHELSPPEGHQTAGRRYTFELFAECLQAVRGEAPART